MPPAATSLYAVMSFLAALNFCPAPLVAQMVSEKLDCAKAVATPELAACAAEDLKTADAELHATYKSSLAAIGQVKHLNTNQRRDWERALREAQRHWLAFRDKDCGEVVGWEWFQGTGMATAGLACKAQKTRARIEELKGRYARP